ncbi:hypothetical protein AM228_16745 [Planktothricoides sp. SR001]|nr:hypothetical protein AM228_16745 [Planktothricoides sp. SR001]
MSIRVHLPFFFPQEVTINPEKISKFMLNLSQRFKPPIFSIREKKPSLTRKPGSVNQGASTIPISRILPLTSGNFWPNLC